MSHWLPNWPTSMWWQGLSPSIQTISIRSSKKNGKRMEFPPLRRESFTATTRKKVFSDNDSISFQKALVTPVQAIDAKRTAGVQAWAMIHWTEIVKHTTPKVLWSIIAYFIVLIWVSLSFLKKPQEKETPANPDCIPCEEIPDNPDYIQLGKMTLKLESKKLYIGDRLCHIAPADFNLLELFIKRPSIFWLKKILKMLSGRKITIRNKIYSHISTLKSSLKDFPEYQIVTEKGGYRLVISSNEWIAPISNNKHT